MFFQLRASTLLGLKPQPYQDAFFNFIFSFTGHLTSIWSALNYWQWSDLQGPESPPSSFSLPLSPFPLILSSMLLFLQIPHLLFFCDPHPHNGPYFASVCFMKVSNLLSCSDKKVLSGQQWKKTVPPSTQVLSFVPDLDLGTPNFWIFLVQIRTPQMGFHCSWDSSSLPLSRVQRNRCSSWTQTSSKRVPIRETY